MRWSVAPTTWGITGSSAIASSTSKGVVVPVPIAMVLRDLLQHHQAGVLEDPPIETAKPQPRPPSAREGGKDSLHQVSLPGRRPCQRTEQLVARVIAEVAHRPADGRETDIIDRQITAGAQEAGRIEPIQEGVIEGVPAIDEDKVKAAFSLLEQELGQGKLALGLHQPEKPDPGFFQVPDAGPVPLGGLVGVDDDVGSSGAAEERGADVQRRKPVSTPDLQRLDDGWIIADHLEQEPAFVTVHLRVQRMHLSAAPDHRPGSIDSLNDVVHDRPGLCKFLSATAASGR